jgi:hypothetical protein
MKLKGNSELRIKQEIYRITGRARNIKEAEISPAQRRDWR